MTRTRKILFLGIVLTILALLAFQPGSIKGHGPLKIPHSTYSEAPALFRSFPEPDYVSPVPVNIPATTTTSTTTTTTTEITDTVTPYERTEWDRVNVCEEGGNWTLEGSFYSGGLGISNTNWIKYGGLQYAPNGGEATPDEQIMIAEHIQFDPPDQGYCASW